MPARESQIITAEWRVDVPAFLSEEDLAEGEPGFLGVDYANGTDSRWHDRLYLAPLLNSVNLSPAGGTAANTNGVVDSGTMNATVYLYFIRGTKWAKVQASNMTLISDGTETALAERATCILRVKSASAEEIAIGMAGTAYRVIATVSSGGTTDTHSANNESIVNRFMAMASPGDTVAGLSGNSQVVRQNVVTGSVTMDASAWATRSTLTGEQVTFTGFAFVGQFWMPGTSNGPYYKDNEFLEFRPLIPEIENTNTNGGWQNCTNMVHSSRFGILVPLEQSLRAITDPLGGGGSVGVETFSHWNRSPIQGYCTGLWPTQKWHYYAWRNPATDKVWIIAGRKRETGDWHNQDQSFFPLFALTDGHECDVVRSFGKIGGRTNPTVVIGDEDDMAWWSDGRVEFFPDDTNYRYAASGSCYLTTLRRYPNQAKEMVAVELETANCASGRTVAVYASTDAGTTWTQLGATETTNGRKRFVVSPGNRVYGTEIKLRIDLATNDSTSSPYIKGSVKGKFRLSPLAVDGHYLEDT